MWRDSMDELIADLEQIVEVKPQRFNDHIPPLEELQAWASRTLLTAHAAERAGKDPAEIDPTFEEEFAAFQAKWPRFYKLETFERK